MQWIRNLLGENASVDRERKKGHKYTLRIFIWYFYDCFNRYQLKCARANALQTRATHLQGPFAWICALLQRMLLYTAHWPNHNKRWNFHIGISQIKIRTNKSTIKWMVLFFVFSSFLLYLCVTGCLPLRFVYDRIRTKLCFMMRRTNLVKRSTHGWWPNWGSSQ